LRANFGEGLVVTESGIAQRYESFALLLEEGGFEAVADGGWTAELVAAHLAVNNDLIAEAAERVADGEADVAYDNADAIDEEVLTLLIEQSGGLQGLADALRESAGRLEQAHLALGPDQVDLEIPALIKDAGEVVLDGVLAMGALIAGNASFHLENHFEQLRALLPAREADPPDEFDCYELVLLYATAPEVAAGYDDEAKSSLQRQHLGHFANMLEAGHMLVAGPLDGGGDDNPVGIGLYRTGSVDKTRELAEIDPKVRAGLLRPVVLSWYTAKGALEFPLNSPRETQG
jgi:uncharacterized protein YciI